MFKINYDFLEGELGRRTTENCKPKTLNGLLIWLMFKIASDFLVTISRRYKGMFS